MKMTINALLEAADNYFARHLDREEWRGFSKDVKIAALYGGEADAALFMGSIEADSDDPRILKAIFEQAVFLAAQSLEPPRRGELVEEAIDGVGRRRWQIPDRETGEGRYTPRAEALLNAAKNAALRLARG